MSDKMIHLSTQYTDGVGDMLALLPVTYHEVVVLARKRDGENVAVSLPPKEAIRIATVMLAQAEYVLSGDQQRGRGGQ